VPRHLRAAAQPGVEVVAAHADEHGVGDRRPRGVARPGVEERQLAEHLARPQDGEQVLAAVSRRPAELDLALDDDVEPVAGVALVEHGLTARNLDPGHHRLQGLRGLVVESGEQRCLAHDLVVHRSSS
jgi:hypothetical protein